MKIWIKYLAVLISGAALATVALLAVFGIPGQDQQGAEIILPVAPTGQHIAFQGPPPGMQGGAVGMSEPQPMNKPQQEGSPYLAYPLSFPKVLAGLLYYEEKFPNLAATPDQCRHFIPILEGMGHAWGETHELEKVLQKILTLKQEQYVALHKHEIEKTTSFQKAGELLRKKYPRSMGMGGIGGATELCAIRAAENKDRPPEAMATGDPLITIFDISSGIIFMEDDPELSITSDQGRKLQPLLAALDGYNKIVDQYFQLLKMPLTQEQIDAVGKNIKEITDLKFATFKQPGGPFNDPLIFTVLELCRKKAGVAAAP